MGNTILYEYMKYQNTKRIFLCGILSTNGLYKKQTKLTKILSNLKQENYFL